jgi:hypothetical protein
LELVIWQGPARSKGILLFAMMRMVMTIMMLVLYLESTIKRELPVVVVVVVTLDQIRHGQ